MIQPRESSVLIRNHVQAPANRITESGGDPTPDEIAERAAEVRSGWSLHERLRRSGCRPRPFVSHPRRMSQER